MAPGTLEAWGAGRGQFWRLRAGSSQDSPKERGKGKTLRGRRPVRAEPSRGPAVLTGCAWAGEALLSCKEGWGTRGSIWGRGPWRRTLSGTGRESGRRDNMARPGLDWSCAPCLQLPTSLPPAGASTARTQVSRRHLWRVGAPSQVLSPLWCTGAVPTWGLVSGWWSFKALRETRASFSAT